MKNLFRISLGACAFAVCIWGTTKTLAQTALRIRQSAPRTIEITWPNTASTLALEESDSVGSAATWRPVTVLPVLKENQNLVSLTLSESARFFRLGAPTLTTIRETSPHDGETEVAVTRETIVRLTAPLAPGAALSTTNLYAIQAGRKFLSRVELSSDRRTATLFYLETLPGSTRVQVVFDGTGLTDATDRPLDLDGDGQPGGNATIAFETLSLTPLSGIPPAERDAWPVRLGWSPLLMRTPAWRSSM